MNGTVVGDATVLRHVKGPVLAMLENRQAPIFCAWLRSRRARKRAAPLTRLALRGVRTVSGRGTFRHIDATRSPRGVEQGTDVGCRKPVGRDAHRLDEHQGKMRRDNCQWQQPTVTAYRSPALLRQARSGVHDHRNRCSRSTGLAVHNHRNPQPRSRRACKRHLPLTRLSRRRSCRAAPA
jgi:hypothetical protein